MRVNIKIFLYITPVIIFILLVLIAGKDLDMSVEKRILDTKPENFCISDSSYQKLLKEDFQNWSRKSIDKLILIIGTSLNKDEITDLKLLKIMVPLFRVHYQLSASIQDEITRAFEEYKDEDVYIHKCQVIPDLRNALVFWERETLGNLEQNMLGKSTKSPEVLLKAMKVIHDSMMLEEFKKADDQKIIVE